MNCANHPESQVSAYCQNCGKPLCNQCVRSVAGVIYCEPCLAAKLGVPGATQGAYTANAGESGPYQYTAAGPLPPSAGPNPALATLLGFIPGVGAMYNGQFIKALVHVLVFVVLIGITDEHGIFGLFIGAWILYQVFDANQTAKARRDGLPLPDPFGLNELGHRLGIQHPMAAPGYVPPAAGPIPGPVPGATPPYPGAATPYPGAATPYAGAAAPYPGASTPYPGATAPNPGASAPFTAGTAPPAADPFVPNTEYVPFTPVDSMPPYPPVPQQRAEPVGAIVLIGLGLLFLFGTLGIFHFNWIGRGWPVIIIVVGIWMFMRRTRETTKGGGQ